jgi:hypothetical protein
VLQQGSWGSDLDPVDLERLAPFLNQIGDRAPRQVVRLHVSPSCRSYLVESGPEAGDRVVVKAYRPDEIAFAACEVRHLLQAQEITRSVPDTNIRIPRVVWSSREHGMLATAWISGEDLSQALLSGGRLGSDEAVQHERDVKSLIEWLVALNEQGAPRIGLADAALQDSSSWDTWLSWLRDAAHFGERWRTNTAEQLQLLRQEYPGVCPRPGPFHGDFTTWNVRRDRSGALWVLDWRRLELGHWLEAAYRFYYVLRVGSMSSLARPLLLSSLADGVEAVIRRRVPNWQVRRYYRCRAILRDLFYACKRPPSSLRRRLRQIFYVRELSRALKGCR